jgi:hypothetical protein
VSEQATNWLILLLLLAPFRLFLFIESFHLKLTLVFVAVRAACRKPAARFVKCYPFLAARDVRLDGCTIHGRYERFEAARDPFMAARGVSS